MSQTESQSGCNCGRSCVCIGAGPALSDFLRGLGPSSRVAEHFRAAQLEVLKGLRAMLDDQIASRSAPSPHGTRITVE